MQVFFGVYAWRFQKIPEMGKSGMKIPVWEPGDMSEFSLKNNIPFPL